MDLLNHRLVRAGVVVGCALALGCSEVPARVGIVEEVRADEGRILMAEGVARAGAARESAWLAIPDPALLSELAPGQRVTYRLRAGSARPEIADLAVVGWAGAAEGWIDVPGGGRIPAHPAPALRLEDQAGRSVDLADWRGGLVVVDFIYTRCPGPCPAQTHDLVSVQRGLSPAARARTRFASVTLEPEFDDGPVLLAYASAHGVDLTDWSFLTGPPQQVEAAVRAWGIGASGESDGTIAHTLHSFLVDDRGYVVARYSSRDRDPDVILAAIERFSAAAERRVGRPGGAPPAVPQ